jgi:N4-gp56 family major capsid protein
VELGLLDRIRSGVGLQAVHGGENSIIKTHRDLIDGGKDLIIPLVGSLKGRGTGAAQLTGNEEAADTFDFRVRPWWRRNAIAVKKSAIQKSVIDLLKANKGALKLWSTDTMKEELIEAFSHVAIADSRYDEDNGYGRGVPYAEATATQRNNWLTDNSRRVLFGIAESNLSAGNMATSLGNVDTTADKWSAGMVSKLKEMARRRNRSLGQRSLRPFKTMDGKEYFVLFVPTRGFNDLRADADIKAFNKDARPRDVDANPAFQGGDLMWDGVIIHEEPDLPILTGVGAASCDVAPGHFCGAQAIAIGWGQDPISTRRSDDDYQFIKGVGTEELRSIDKTFFASASAVGPGEQFGMLTGYGAVA